MELNPNFDSMLVGESIDVELSLNLGLSEKVSAFEGIFSLMGLDSIANVSLSNVGGPTWSSAVGNIVRDEVGLSTTSSNLGGIRSLGTATVFGTNPGTLQLFFLDSSFAATDIGGTPFVMDVPISNTDREVLGTIQVRTSVPETSTFFLFATGLMLF